MNGTLEERFWAKVDTSSDCWLWTASTNRDGYGRFWDGIDMRLAHRVSWIIANGAVPDGLLLDHTCHTPACVNPSHLRFATHKQNHENLTGAYRNSRSGVRGVVWIARLGKWSAEVRSNGERHYLGLFEDLAAADLAVSAARRRLFTHSDMDILEV